MMLRHAIAFILVHLGAAVAHADIATPEVEQCLGKREGDLCGVFDTCQTICRQGGSGEGEGDAPPTDCPTVATDECDDIAECRTQLVCGGEAGCSDAGPPRRRSFALAGVAAALALGIALGRTRRRS